MGMKKIRYYERASLFDRGLILLLGLTCIFLLNLVVRSSYGPCTESLRVIKELKANVVASKHGSDHDLDEPAGSSHDENGAALKAEKSLMILKNQTQRNSAPSSFQTSSVARWRNSHDIVHVVLTRFMQLQPDLIHLGKARIELFKTFTLRSMREQTTQEFLWIIFTDPELDSEVVKAMVELLGGDRNILLLGMNVGFMDFRNSGWVTDIEEVFSGDLELLKDYVNAAQNHVYLETRIDADDSMYYDFMNRVQTQTSRTLGVSAKKAKRKVEVLSKNPEYRVFCPEHHLEWGYFNPWQPNSTKGHLYGVSTPQLCITAGLTYAFQIGTESEGIKLAHNQLTAAHSQCNTTDSNRNCVDRIDDRGAKYVILRSRTPTSAGMAGVIPTSAVVNSPWSSVQDMAWKKYIFPNFGITPKSIWELRKYLTDHMENILKDALTGQCTRDDFTCKKSSKDDLTKLLNQVKQYKGGRKKKRRKEGTNNSHENSQQLETSSSRKQ